MKKTFLLIMITFILVFFPAKIRAGEPETIDFSNNQIELIGTVTHEVNNGLCPKKDEYGNIFGTYAAIKEYNVPKDIAAHGDVRVVVNSLDNKGYDGVYKCYECGSTKNYYTITFCGNYKVGVGTNDIQNDKINKINVEVEGTYFTKVQNINNLDTALDVYIKNLSVKDDPVEFSLDNPPDNPIVITENNQYLFSVLQPANDVLKGRLTLCFAKLSDNKKHLDAVSMPFDYYIIPIGQYIEVRKDGNTVMKVYPMDSFVPSNHDVNEKSLQTIYESDNLSKTTNIQKYGPNNVSRRYAYNTLILSTKMQRLIPAEMLNAINDIAGLNIDTDTGSRTATNAIMLGLKKGDYTLSIRPVYVVVFDINSTLPSIYPDDQNSMLIDLFKNPYVKPDYVNMPWVYYQSFNPNSIRIPDQSLDMLRAAVNNTMQKKLGHEPNNLNNFYNDFMQFFEQTMHTTMKDVVVGPEYIVNMKVVSVAGRKK